MNKIEKCQQLIADTKRLIGSANPELTKRIIKDLEEIILEWEKTQ